jgi:hypothetical protein
VFVVRRLSQLVFYNGDKPWTGGILQARHVFEGQGKSISCTRDCECEWIATRLSCLFDQAVAWPGGVMPWLH